MSVIKLESLPEDVKNALAFANEIHPLSDHIAALLDFSEILEFSDLMIESGADISIRIPGGWIQTGYGVVEKITLDNLISTFREIDSSFTQVNTEKPRSQLSLRIGEWRVRCTIFTSNAGACQKLMMRKLPAAVPALESLGLGILVHQLVNAQRGLVVVSGPTGSGKSTTMAALVQAILNERQVHAVTIEDPIEYELQRGVGIVTQREVGVDETTYMDALVQVLRQTPDVILVGEVRTKLEAEVVFRATEHGRFVIMSTHGRDGISALQKLLSFFPADEQASKAAMLANHLVATIHQSLIPSAQKNGWELAYESFFIGDNTEIMNLVQDPSKYGTLRQKLTDGGWAGCTSMNRVLTKLVADKKISRASAIATSVDSVGLKAMLDAA